MTHLIDHISDLTLDFVCVNLLLVSQAERSCEVGEWDPRPANRWIGCRVLETASEECLPQKVAETGIVSSLQGKVDASLHELILTILEGLVKGVQIALLDASRQRQEELLQMRIWLQEFLCREGVGGEEMTWDKVGQDQPAISSALVLYTISHLLGFDILFVPSGIFVAD